MKLLVGLWCEHHMCVIIMSTRFPLINKGYDHSLPAVKCRKKGAPLAKHQRRFEVHDGLSAEGEPAASMRQEVALQHLSEGELRAEVHVLPAEDPADVVLEECLHALPRDALDESVFFQAPEVPGDRVVPPVEEVVVHDEVERHLLAAGHHVVECGHGNLVGDRSTQLE